MDYGRPLKPVFVEIQNFWAWADKFWGIWGTFGQAISTQWTIHSATTILEKCRKVVLHPSLLIDVRLKGHLHRYKLHQIF